MVYLGRTRWTLNKKGGFSKTLDGYDEDTIVSEDGHSIVLDMGTVNSSDKSLSSGANAKKMFEFVAKYSDVEWAMIENKDGSAKVYTNKIPNHVDLNFNPSNTKRLVHSHTSEYGNELSDDDKDHAGRYSGITHTLYYNGSYQDYSDHGFYGKEYY